MTEIPLMEQLEAWATSRNLRPSGFACELYETCDSSTHNKLRRSETVCMSYIGSRYGWTDTKPQVRLVVVGKEHRPDEGGTDFADRHRGIIEGYQRRAEKFNPHYRGVVQTAAAVYGSRTECMRCAQQWACQSSRTRDRACVLDMFAQPNLVKCA